MKFEITKTEKNSDKFGTDIHIQDTDLNGGTFIYFVDYKMGSGDVVNLVKRILNDVNFQVGKELKELNELKVSKKDADNLK